MKEVDTFFLAFLSFFRRSFFLPKMVVPQSVSFFLYRSVLCICIYKQIYTNDICRLQSVISVKGSYTRPSPPTPTPILLCNRQQAIII